MHDASRHTARNLRKKLDAARQELKLERRARLRTNRQLTRTQTELRIAQKGMRLGKTDVRKLVARQIILAVLTAILSTMALWRAVADWLAGGAL